MRVKLILGIIFICSGFIFQGCSNEYEKEANAGNFTCPMHPQIMNTIPATCPVCKMDLVPVNSTGGNHELSLSESQIRLANIQTMIINRADFSTSKVLNGRLVVNPEQTEIISSRYAGRIEKLFVKEMGRFIARGQPLFQIYSEELQILQQELLLQVKQSAAFPEERIYHAMQEAAKNKLRLFGYSDAQMRSLITSGKTAPLVTVYSTASGVITDLNVSEGQYLAQGSQVLKLENFKQLWLEMDVYPGELSGIHLGKKVEVDINGIHQNRQILTIDFISPQIDPSLQILKVRASINNPGNLQAGMQATVFVPLDKISDAMSLPLDAVIRDENGAHVWVKKAKNTFSPRKVITGEEDAERIIILSGLEDAHEVVVSGAYLLSSEFILKRGVNPILHNDVSKL